MLKAHNAADVWQNRGGRNATEHGMQAPKMSCCCVALEFAASRASIQAAHTAHCLQLRNKKTQCTAAVNRRALPCGATAGLTATAAAVTAPLLLLLLLLLPLLLLLQLPLAAAPAAAHTAATTVAVAAAHLLA
jgi:hypothetical protein